MRFRRTGPLLRSTGYPWDLRRDDALPAYDELEFDVIVGTYGDSFDRYAIRLNEIRESIKIVRQFVDRMPSGDYRVQDKKMTPPPRARIDESMEALIHHFKIFTEGYKVPEGEAYVAVESPRGELGCYIVSDGSSKPYRMHIRGPSFVNLQTLPHLMQRRAHRGRRGQHLLGRPDHGRGRPMKPAHGKARTPSSLSRTSARYPRQKSALIPLLHLAQEQDGWVTDRCDGAHRRAVDVTPAEVIGTRSFYEMFKFHPAGRYMVNVCTNISCQLLGAEDMLHHAESTLGVRAGSTTADGLFTFEDVECIAACTEAPCLQVNYRYFNRVTVEGFDAMVADLRAGRTPANVIVGESGEMIPGHGAWGSCARHIPAGRAVGAVPPEDVTEGPVWLARNVPARGQS